MTQLNNLLVDQLPGCCSWGLPGRCVSAGSRNKQPKLCCQPSWEKCFHSMLNEEFFLKNHWRYCTTHWQNQFGYFRQNRLFHIQPLFKIEADHKCGWILSLDHVCYRCPKLSPQASVLNVLNQTLDSWRKEGRCAGKLWWVSVWLSHLPPTFIRFVSDGLSAESISSAEKFINFDLGSRQSRLFHVFIPAVKTFPTIVCCQWERSHLCPQWHAESISKATVKKTFKLLRFVKQLRASLV